MLKILRIVSKVFGYGLLAVFLGPILCMAFILMLFFSLSYMVEPRTCDLSGERLNVDFHGYPLDLETKYVLSCTLDTSVDSLGLEPARIDFGLKYPGFTELESLESGSFKLEKDTIHLSLTAFPKGDSENKPLKLDFKQYANRNKCYFFLYEATASQFKGFEGYKKTEDAFAFDSEEVFLRRDEVGDVDFILRCNRGTCSADARSLPNGLMYSYYFRKDLAPDLLEIEEKALNFITDIQGMGDSDGRAD